MNDNNIKLLLSNDFIYKYNLKANQKKSFLNKIIIHFSINSFETNEKIISINTDTSSQLKIFLIIYLLFAKLSKINLKKNQIVLKNIYAFKNIFTSKKDIKFFLKFLFVENNLLFNIPKKDGNTRELKLNKKFTVNQSFNGQLLFKTNYIFNSVFLNFKTKKFYIKTSFVFTKKKFNIDSFISNNFLFWLTSIVIEEEEEEEE